MSHGEAGQPLALELPADLVEAIAHRVADLLAEREQSAGAGADTAGFLDVTEAARYLACPSSRVYALTSSGRLPHYKDGSRLLFDRAELREYVRTGGARRP